ncbi:PadR family transcriptional regulator [Demequina lutea]|uniref:DNA-binding PadR family transcriptional regulator n=1 Tax=Demequina lutea TaxID=431489 RepID=A0A7Y9ZEC1_9MICO|nr:PadR family transcriptional regulator [Demequina lutea]NYI42415.1 DNA-binding PadR family transcriptional regulator [Demequina lutea]
MSIRHSLLVLLSESDRYGYELRTEFEGRTGGVWPLNVGQVYSTLDRLERDGLVTREDVDGERQVRYSLSDAGRAALSAWWASPVPVSKVGRDDVALKIALAASTAGVDVVDVIRAQRRSVMSALQDLNRAKRAGSDEAWELVADALIFRAEAEVRWLDHTAARLARRPRHPVSQPATEPSEQHSSQSEEVR